MIELSRYLFLGGAIPFLVLGVAHVIATPLRIDQVKGLAPRDPALAQAMSQVPLRLTRRTDMWRCWVGFNLSHGLGVVFFAVVVLVIGRSPASFLADGGVFGPLAIAVSGAYFGLGTKYWFRTPIVGCAISAVLFVSSWILGLGAR